MGGGVFVFGDNAPLVVKDIVSERPDFFVRTTLTGGGDHVVGGGGVDLVDEASFRVTVRSQRLFEHGAEECGRCAPCADRCAKFGFAQVRLDVDGDFGRDRCYLRDMRVEVDE